MAVVMLKGVLMYNWRKMTNEQGNYVLKIRKEQNRPRHSLPHTVTEREYFHLSAACYEHKSIIGSSILRMIEFEDVILKAINTTSEKICSYVFLPNHYHVLIKVDNVKTILDMIFKIHRKIAIKWNKEDNLIGRKVWCNVMESGIKCEKHFWSVMNYIQNNPVKHGYVNKWVGWPYSSAEVFIKNEGIEKTLFLWKKYDISKMCQWDI